jgi:hypothetical protein
MSDRDLKYMLAKYMLAAPVIGVIILVGFAFLTNEKGAVYSAALPSGTAIFETSLQDRISSSDTSMSLVSVSIRGGATLSGYQCFTIDEGRSDSEFVCGTVSGTTVSALERGLDPSNGTTTVTALRFQHRKGADVKITDFPLIQRIKAQVNGEDGFNNLLNYKYSPSYVGASTTAIVSYGLLQQTSFAGTVNADDATKGIVELATGAEGAAGTSIGGTGARLAIGANIATSTCQYAANSALFTLLSNGKLSSNCVDQTASYSWSGAHAFSGAFSVSGATTFNTAATFNATTTMPGFIATSTATSTIAGNLTIANNASTSNLIVSNSCKGCSASGYERVVGSTALATANNNVTTATATCSAGKVVTGGGWSSTLVIPGGSPGYSVVQIFPPNNTSMSASTTCFTGGSCSSGTLSVYAICINQ